MTKAGGNKSSSIAIIDQECAIRSILLVAADIWFPDPELAGLAVVRMRGDSMGDTLRNGDFALIDTQQTEIGCGGVFGVLDNGSVTIYQVEKLYPSRLERIRCTPRNPHYRPFELTLGKDARIIGRVVQKITRL
jgi:phage repressor protein C with HTH and peptisase S24 domain